MIAVEMARQGKMECRARWSWETKRGRERERLAWREREKCGQVTTREAVVWMHSDA